MTALAQTVNSPAEKPTITCTVNNNSSEYVYMDSNVNGPLRYAFYYNGSDEFVKWEIVGLNSDEYDIEKQSAEQIIINVKEESSNKDFSVNVVTKVFGSSNIVKDNKAISPRTGYEKYGLASGIIFVICGVVSLIAVRKRLNKTP